MEALDRVNDRRPLKIVVGSLPPRADAWVELYRSRHRLYPASEHAVRTLRRGLGNRRPRSGVRTFARELHMESMTLLRVVWRLVDLGAFEVSVDGDFTLLTSCWPPKAPAQLPTEEAVASG